MTGMTNDQIVADLLPWERVEAWEDAGEFFTGGKKPMVIYIDCKIELYFTNSILYNQIITLGKYLFAVQLASLGLFWYYFDK